MAHLTHGIGLNPYKAQAKELLRQVQAGEPEALTWLRANHPEGAYLPLVPRVQLADVQLVIARENGCGSWAKFKHCLLFLQAVRALDQGDLRELAYLLDTHPIITRYHCHYGEYENGYFAGATLLHHIAGNPIRCPIPENIVEITRLLLERGADPRAKANPATPIGLLLTSKQASEAGVALPLINILRDAGATDAINFDDPQLLDDPIWNGGLETAQELVRRGARMALPQAAALGRLDVIQQIVREYGIEPDLMEVALIFACVQNQEEAARCLVSHGAKGDVIPSAGRRGGGQATALHNAAWRGCVGIVHILLDTGCQATIRDLQWNGTPADWAEHGGHAELAALLRQHEVPKPNPPKNITNVGTTA